MPRLKKTGLVLPAEVVAAFTATTDTEKRNQYVRALRSRSWTLQSIAAAAAVSRERIRQITNTEYSTEQAILDTFDLPLPFPPEVPEKVAKVYTEPDPTKLARLLELKPLAEKVRSNSPDYRKEAEEYTALIWDVYHNDGVPLYRLALRLGITHGACRFRLHRYGYLTTKPGAKSKVYQPIKSGNRAI